MAFSYLGPESPRPLSVISEGFQTRYHIPTFPSWEQFTFGEKYDDLLFNLINKYMDLETTDRLCYVGDTKGSMAEAIVERYCLLEPMLTVVPGHYTYVETDDNKVLPIRVAHVGSEEYFRIEGRKKDGERQIFDKIILKDALRYFENPVEMYTNMIKCLSTHGRILIVHRPSSINTLPIFQNAKQRLEDNETPYDDVIKDLKALDFDVQWEIECLPIQISKKKWYSMLESKFPPQMEIMSDFEVRSGIRELAEGVMKYEGDVVEFTDRLLFIVVTKPTHKRRGYPSVKRYNADDLMPFPTDKDLMYSMEVSADLKKYVNQKQRRKEPESCSIFC